MPVTKSSFNITNNIKRNIKGDIRLPEKPGRYPFVFILHGFKSFKDWGFFPYVAEKIASIGAISICFNFSLNGIDGDSDVLKRPDDFADNTISQQLVDFSSVLDAFTAAHPDIDSSINDKWNGNIFVVGHSLGAAIGLLTARNNPNISRLAMWSSVSKFDRYSLRQKEEWRKMGYLEFINQRTGQSLKMNLSYLDDFLLNKEKFDLPKAASELNIPLLIVHASEDLTAKISEAEELASAYTSKENNMLMMKVIQKTGHIFGIEHPFTGSTDALEETIKITVEFFELK